MDATTATPATKTPNLRGVSAFMAEYVAWGGPIVTRANALADAQLRGFNAREIDLGVFARRAVEAPENPAEHIAFLHAIQQRDGLR